MNLIVIVIDLKKIITIFSNFRFDVLKSALYAIKSIINQLITFNKNEMQRKKI